MLALDVRFGCHVMGHPVGERLVDGDGHLPGQPAWPLVEALSSHQVRVRSARLGVLLGVGADQCQH
jgi:5-enolpyruvylshikimate-3-phosphate synthase